MVSLPDSYSNSGYCPDAPECVKASTLVLTPSGDEYYEYSAWLRLNYRSENHWQFVLRQGTTEILGLGLVGFGTGGDAFQYLTSNGWAGYGIGTSHRESHWYKIVIQYNPVQNKANYYIYDSDGTTVEFSATDVSVSAGSIDNLALYNLNRMPYGGARDFYWDDITTPSLRIQATVNIDPDSLNLNSNGKWITADIELPAGYSVEDIDITTVKLQGEFAARHSDVQGNKLMVKFSRKEVTAALSEGSVKLTVTGEIYEGPAFEGSDTIRVINEGR